MLDFGSGSRITRKGFHDGTFTAVAGFKLAAKFVRTARIEESDVSRRVLVVVRPLL
jgi:hypothetical protein